MVNVSLTWLAASGLRKIEFAPACSALGTLRSSLTMASVSGRSAALRSRAVVSSCAASGCLIPIDDDDLKILCVTLLDSGRRLGAVLSLHTETRQHLENGLSRSLIRGKQEATKGHAPSD